MSNDVIQVLGYQRRDMGSRAVAFGEWLFQARRPRPPLAKIASHSAALVPYADGLYRMYQAVASGVENCGVVSVEGVAVQRDLIAMIPVYAPHIERARAWARHQVGDDYAWSQIAAAAWDEIVPSFLEVTGQHPREQICSGFVAGLLLAGGRVFDRPAGVITPFTLTRTARALARDYAACRRSFALELQH